MKENPDRKARNSIVNHQNIFTSQVSENRSHMILCYLKSHESENLPRKRYTDNHKHHPSSMSFQ